MRQNLYVFSLYRNPDLDDLIFDCLLASMAAVQAEDVRAYFLFVGDLNGHHQEWLGSMTTNHHGVATFDFTTVSNSHHSLYYIVNIKEFMEFLYHIFYVFLRLQFLDVNPGLPHPVPTVCRLLCSNVQDLAGPGRDAGFYGLWCETELICVQSLPQP